VPRSPLGELIVRGYTPWWTGAAPLTILDLCCGGGCIGIAAAVYEPRARVVLGDLDAAALDLARDNIERHAVSGRVSVQRSDLFSQLAPQTFDLILCNPPYVDAADIAAMPQEYRREPLHALEAGDDGLDLALEILVEAPHWLAEGGLLFLELGNSWAALDALCESLPLTWLEFAEGGHGVLCIGREDLMAAGPHFTALGAKRGPKRV
jgi:ribosomal protein L3 glutamine methyltransferase